MMKVWLVRHWKTNGEVTEWKILHRPPLDHEVNALSEVVELQEVARRGINSVVETFGRRT